MYLHGTERIHIVSLWFRWSCEQYCGTSSSSRFPSRRAYQEDQSWPTGKHVPASQRGTQWAPQKDHCKPFAKEKTLLLDLVTTFLIVPISRDTFFLKRSIVIHAQQKSISKQICHICPAQIFGLNLHFLINQCEITAQILIFSSQVFLNSRRFHITLAILAHPLKNYWLWPDFF